jgi:hypothetical protein
VALAISLVVLVCINETSDSSMLDCRPNNYGKAVNRGGGVDWGGGGGGLGLTGGGVGGGGGGGRGGGGGDQGGRPGGETRGGDQGRLGEDRGGRGGGGTGREGGGHGGKGAPALTVLLALAGAVTRGEGGAYLLCAAQGSPFARGGGGGANRAGGPVRESSIEPPF